jgi:Trk K+ transport system NAD-binding subunit/nucleotide-binding universal stress UspA family protein
VLIAGIGIIGSSLAQRLAEHVQLILVDIDSARVKQISETLPAAKAGNTTYPHMTIPGDATSRLVLERAGAATVDSLVATCGDDAANFEICSLAHEHFAVPHIVSCLHDEAWKPRFAELGVEVVTTGSTVAAALYNRLDATRHIASDMGLGEGELLETTVGEGSWVIGQPIQALHASGWLIAAIYRAGKLVVPAGHTVLQAGDRILLVGEPQTLSDIADMLHYGRAPFPIPYGRDIAVALPQHGYCIDERQLAIHEGRSLAHACHTGQPVILVPQTRRRHTHWLPQTNHGMLQPTYDWGCITIPAGRPGPLAARGWRHTSAESLLRTFRAPIFFARDHPAFTRIVALLHSEATEIAGANRSRPLDVALSLARMLDLPVVAVTVSPPDYVGGEDSTQAQQAMSQAMNTVATTRRQSFKREYITGNPIQETLRLLQATDLLVVRAARPGGLTPLRPMVGRYLAQYAPCPVILVPDDSWARRMGAARL